MNFDYVEEKKKLKKKVAIFLICSIGLGVFATIAGDTEPSSSIFVGILGGVMFYIPGRIVDYFHMGWRMAIVITVIFIFAVMWLSDMIGNIAWLVLLFPLADMGYSIYKVIKAGKGIPDGVES